MNQQITFKSGVLYVMLLLLSLTPSAFAQNAVSMLKFEDAERAYNAGDYHIVLEALDEVEEMEGVTSKTLYLRVVSQNELFAGGQNLYDGPEQFKQLSELREHVATYLEAMGSQGLDDKYRTVYRIQESLKEFPETELTWRTVFEAEEAKKIRKEYHENGQLKSIGKVEDGVKTGEWRYFNDSGELVVSFMYQPDGSYTRTMFYSNGNAQSIERYNTDSVPEGPFEEYYAIGQLRSKGTYLGINALRYGKYVAYHQNGQLWVQANYNDQGQLIGEYSEYHDNGQVAKQGQYKMLEEGMFSGVFSKEYGQWIYHYDNGQIEKIENYPSPGRLQGQVKEYYRSGEVKSVAQFEGRERLSFRQYYESGQLLLTVLPEDEGFWKYYHENGNLKEMGKMYDEDEDKHGEWKSYHDNGQLAIVENYSIGSLDGDWVSYYRNGQLKEEGEYENGGRDGRWKAYYENGQLMERGRYKSIEEYSYMDNESHKDSRWTYYHPNGEVKAKGTYEMGEKVGSWDYYDEQGNRMDKK